jgi:hypothetical protein
MPRAVDIRIPATQRAHAMRALMDQLAPVTFSIDAAPPAAGPEIEVTVEGHPERVVRQVLEQRGITVLAIRTRLDGPLVQPNGTRNGPRGDSEADQPTPAEESATS